MRSERLGSMEGHLEYSLRAIESHEGGVHDMIRFTFNPNKSKCKAESRSHGRRLGEPFGGDNDSGLY